MRDGNDGEDETSQTDQLRKPTIKPSIILEALMRSG
jgi:hypothetical protein